MLLLVMAHRGEAQEFIKNLHLKADPKLSGFYMGDKVSVLISGEGIYQVFIKLPYLLALHPIKKVINFGIAGALSQDLELGDILPVRTAYGFNENTPKFHSFTAQDHQAQYDCITTDQRVLTDEFAATLSPFASLVDRELWAIASCCQQYNIPFQSYKLISDYAGAKTACFDIKQKALEYSEKLYEEFLSLEQQENQLEEVDIAPPIAMSFSHKIQYKKLIEAIALRDSKTHEQILSEIGLDELLTLDLRAKNKAQKLIQRLDQKLNPLRFAITNQLNQTFDPFYQIGAHIKIDPKLESKKFTLSMEINSEKNLKKLNTALEQFCYQDIEKLWNGGVDV